MIPSAEFRRHAAECSRMARTTLDRTAKTTWKNLAERWAAAAKLAEQSECAVAVVKSKAPRRRAKQFAH
jgi:hypothetical protein